MPPLKIGKTDPTRNGLYLLVTLSFFSAAAAGDGRLDGRLPMRDPDNDFAFLEYEHYAAFDAPTRSKAEEAWSGRVAGQVAFPAGHVAGHEMFGVFKSTLMDRDIAHDDTVLNEGRLLQRYWLSSGMVLLDRPDQSATLMIAGGMNSDMADIGPMDFNSEWLYMHNFTFSPSFSLGAGLDLQQYFHSFEIYPLIFIDWRIDDRTRFKWDADYIELRRFFGPSLAVTVGTRFNLEFFALAHDARYEYHSLGAETGLQYALGRNWYVRLKYKELVWGREYYSLPDGRTFKDRIEGGRSLRLNFAYGI